MKYWIAYIFFSLISYSAFCQVLDADRATDDDTIPKKFNCIVSLTGSIDKQKKDLADGSSIVDLTYVLPKQHLLILKGSTDFTTNGSEFLQNSGYVHLRVRDNDTRKLSPEYFGQYQWNGLLGMKSRKLIGSNLRWLLINQSNINDLFIGLGMMYENEKWNYNGVKINFENDHNPDTLINKVRINQYVKCAFVINEKVDLVLSNFIQSDVTNLLFPRVSTNAAFNFKMATHISASVNIESTYDFKPVVPIDKYIYSLKLLLNFNL